MDLDAEIDSLYAGPPDDFVAERDALAKRLRGEGDKDAAKEVKALRRPTVAAWGVNLVARDDPDGVEALLTAGTELARAQRRALSGVRDSGLRDAAAQRRGVVGRLADRAVTLLDEAGASGEAHRDAIATTLEAASASEEAAEPVRRGRLSRELPAPSGFGDVAGLALLEPEPADEEPADAAEAPAEDDGERRRLEAAVRDARQTLDDRRQAASETEAEARDSRRQAEEAARAADDADGEADRLERAAAKARRDAERARRAAERAEDEVDERQELAARRRKAVLAADEALDEAEQALRAAQKA